MGNEIVYYSWEPILYTFYALNYFLILLFKK